MFQILVVEDDRNLNRTVCAYLDQNGYEATGCLSANEAYDAMYGNLFDLIISDIMMPGVDGFSVCRTLRGTLDIPILMVTARQEDIDKIKGLGMGADDYITKPFSPNVLVARIKANLAQYDRLKNSGSRDRARISLGSVTLHTDTRRVFVDGTEVPLKNKEFELLYFLMSNADIVFSREALYERIWGYDALGDNATVAVHINRLREKIERDPSKPRYIQTVWGAGYRFKP